MMKHFWTWLLTAWLFAVQLSFAQQQDSITLLAIDVSARQSEGELKSIAGSISVLTSSELEKQDEILITNHLNSMPGIFMHNGTFSTNRIVIRGIGSRTPYGTNRIRAYLNDIPLTNGDGVTTLEDIDVTQLDRLEVMKGPNSALYGAGLGGTIKLNTRNPDGIAGVSFRYGSFNTSKMNIESDIRLPKHHLGITANRTYSDGFRENSRYQKNGLLITGNRSFPKTNLTYTLLINHIDAQIPSSINLETFQESPEKAAANWLAVEGFKKNLRTLGGITLQHRMSEHWSGKTTLFGSYSDAYEKRPFGDLDEQTLGYGLRSQFRYQQQKLGAVAGIELFNENYHWRTFPLGNNPNANADIDETRSFGNVFVLINYEQSDRLQFTAGANLNRITYRYTDINNNTGQHSYPFVFSPRVGANYAATRFVNFYASVGHGFSPPSLEETLLPEGEKNPDIAPEQGYMYEAGLRISGLQSRLFVDATIYHISLNNMLVTKRITEEIFTGINAGKTAHSGFELQLAYDVIKKAHFPGKVGISSSLTLSNNRFVDFTDDGNNYSGMQLPGVPSRTVYTGVSWQPINALSFNVNYRYTGAQYLNDANSGTIDGYHLTDMKIGYRTIIGKIKVELTGGVNNLFDTRYASMLLVNAPSFGSAAPRYYYPGLPRNFYMGVRIGI